MLRGQAALDVIHLGEHLIGGDQPILAAQTFARDVDEIPIPRPARRAIGLLGHQAAQLLIPVSKRLRIHAIFQQPPRVNYHRDVKVRVVIGGRVVGQCVRGPIQGMRRSLKQIVALQLDDEDGRRQREGGRGILPFALLIRVDDRARAVLMLLPEIDVGFDELEIIRSRHSRRLEAAFSTSLLAAIEKSLKARGGGMIR